jgi:prephenate dehydrogenase
VSTDPPFPSIAPSVGLGLIGEIDRIGGSGALARVTGVRRRQRGRARRTHSGRARLERRLREYCRGATTPRFVVLAAPVRQNIELLQQIKRPAVATDVSGTKRDIVSAARALSPGTIFVGGHPLGGGERGGFAFARPDLFAGRPWIFTPDGDDATEAVERLSRFVTGLGARPCILSAEEHDRVMAYVSHLPQLAASALMEAVGAAAGSDGLRMAGRGLVDTTRLASSPADVWRDICLTNADAIGDALDCLIARLTQLRGDLGTARRSRPSSQRRRSGAPS